jgi:uncharacterized damage-inducible protein DinB
MNTDALKLLFQINHHVIGVNARDLTHEESLIQPQPAGNCVNWVLGHIVHTRGAVLRLVGETPVWTEAEGERYKRGAAPIDAAERAMPYPEILEALDRSQERLMRGLGRLDDRALGPVSDEGSLAHQLTTLQFHESYHAGQLGILRRLAGKRGAIR